MVDASDERHLFVDKLRWGAKLSSGEARATLTTLASPVVPGVLC